MVTNLQELEKEVAEKTMRLEMLISSEAIAQILISKNITSKEEIETMEEKVKNTPEMKKVIKSIKKYERTMRDYLKNPSKYFLQELFKNKNRVQ